jgi:dipeptide/tripeptide permease
MSTPDPRLYPGYVTPLIGGLMADSFMGRYRAILIFSSIYVVGLLLLVLGVIPVSSHHPPYRM